MTMLMTGAGKAKAVAVLSAPTNLAAEVGQDGLSAALVTYTWGASAGANNYQAAVKIAANDWGDYSDFGNVLSLTLGPNGDIGTDVADAGIILLRVRATNGVQTSAPSNVAVAALFTADDTTTPFDTTGMTNLVVRLRSKGDAGGGGSAKKTVASTTGTYSIETSAGLVRVKNAATTIIARATAASGNNPGVGNVGDVLHTGGTSSGNSGGGCAGDTGDGAPGNGAGGAAGPGGTLSGAGGDLSINGGSFGGGAGGGATPGGPCIAVTATIP